MVFGVICMTLGADNAAAFAAGYAQFADMARVDIAWLNLFPSVTFGGISPFGNGPQITFFLVILTAMGMTTAKEVFKAWLIEAWVFLPYLGVWTLGTLLTLEMGFVITKPLLLLLGIIASACAFEAQDLQAKFRHHVGGLDWSGREYPEYVKKY
jgi:hypothetical protein